MEPITPELLLAAYANGIFPMSDGRDDPEIFWVDPKVRGVLPLNGFHVPRRLKRLVRQDPFAMTVDAAFRHVMEACAENNIGRPSTWINRRIVDLYSRLHELGHAHSVEAWDGDQLVGGLYGVSLGRAFFGESMFSRRTNASKVALVHLVARLKAGDFRLLDTQFVTRHLEQFGALRMAREQYRALLLRAVDRQAGDAEFYSVPADLSGASALQSISQTS